MRSHGGYGLGKSPLDTFNPVDKILFMGNPIPESSIREWVSHKTKCSFENVSLLFIIIIIIIIIII